MVNVSNSKTIRANVVQNDSTIKANISGTPSASTEVKGIIRIATDEEALEGLDNTIAITPFTLKDFVENNIDGLQEEITSENPLNADLVDDVASTHKFVTSAEKTQITTNANNINTIQDTIDTYGNIVTHSVLEFATSAQGALADTALQPNDNITELVNNAGYITSAGIGSANLTIQRNGVALGTFSANATEALTVNISVPTTATEVGALPSTTTINDLTTSAQQNALNSGATTTNIGQIATNTSAITTINGKIPSQASSSNQLADKSFVNSSIATNTANFIGTFNSVAELESYSGTLTNNDYAFVVTTDSAGNTLYDRYKYNGSEWLFEYELNNSSFTSVQWAAINSGITSSDVTLIGTALQPNDNITELNNNAGYITSADLPTLADLTTTTQLDAINSGITANDVNQIATNTTNITAKADKTNAINGVPLSTSNGRFYGVSDSAATDVEKVVSIPSITELGVGQFIIVQPSITSTVANSTLKLNNFNAYPMIYNNAAITTSSDSTVWSAKFPTIWVFDGEHWVFVAHGYDSDTTYTLNYSIDGGRYTAGVGTYAITRYSLIMQKPDMTWEKITATNKTYTSAANKTVNTNGFILNQIKYYGTTTTLANGALTASNVVYQKAASVTLAYSLNCGTAPGWDVGDYIYLIGTIGADGLFYLDTTQWWSNALPNTNDGKLYIRIGVALNDEDSTATFLDDRPVFYHDGTSIREYVTADNKQNTLVSGGNIKTVNHEPLLGSGNLSVQSVLTNDNAGNNISISSPINLPSGYTQVNGVKSDGTAFINLNTTLTNDDEIEIRFEFVNNTNSKNIFGYRNSATQNNITAFLASTNNNVGIDFNSSSYSSYRLLEALTAGQIYTLKISKNRRAIYRGAVLVAENTTVCNDTINTPNCYLFNIAGTPAYANIFNGTIYECIIKNKRNVISCKNSNNEVGFYDLISGEFFGNAAGSGSFTAGATVSNTTIISFENNSGYITSSALSGYQTTSNLVTSVSASSTDAEYPSAKLFYDTCGDIETLINAL